jgi:hypothetical protein
MAKKILYLVSGWENGSGWSYRNDVLESEKVSDDMTSVPEEAWDYILDALREKDDDELEQIAEAAYTDVYYEIQIIEFDEGGEETVIASEEKWESDLAKEIIEERD